MADDADAEAARAQAEARRRRILEKADKRMGLVSGEQQVDASEVQSSNAARMRARRRGRYGKKSTKKTDASEDKDNTDGGEKASEVSITTATVETTTSDEKQNEVEEPKQDADEGPTEEEVPASATKIPSSEDSAAEAPEPPKAVQEVVEETENASNDSKKTEEDSVAKGEATTKKKYLGVAKRRRQMILKKKQKEEEQASAAEAKSKPVAVTPTKSSVTPFAVIPIYMHIVIVLLLFLAGFDVGLQQVQEDLVLFPDNAIEQYGIPIVHRNIWSTKSKTSTVLKDLEFQSSISPEDLHDEDDFAEEHVPVIDPLFQVDLDELTEGPGILKRLARGAVAAHRFLMYCFFFLPLGIVQTMMAAPQALLQTPPALCVVALLLRQVVGKMILKAGIPSAEGDDKKKDSAIDVLAMAKQWLTNFLASAFPTAVGMYDAFSHLREDMYVVLCGVFCGLLWTHYLSGGEKVDVLATEMGKEEL